MDRDSSPEITRIPTIPPKVKDLRPVRTALEVEVTTTSQSHFFAGLTGDPKRGGIFIATYRALPIGTRLRLDVTVRGACIRADGVVAWHRDGVDGARPGFGVHFEELADGDLELIRSFCAERAAMYVDDAVAS